jgi:hypothetical protein
MKTSLSRHKLPCPVCGLGGTHLYKLTHLAISLCPLRAAVQPVCVLCMTLHFQTWGCPGRGASC